jgi:L-lactate oxidase
VFIAHGAGEQWTLGENRRAFGDYVFTPHRMGGIVRDMIDTSITMLGEKFPHPVFVSPMGSHGLVHPEAEIATAQGAAKSGGLLCVSSASTARLAQTQHSCHQPPTRTSCSLYAQLTRSPLWPDSGRRCAD